MKKYLSSQFPLNNILKDILSGIMVALVSIPISMGYAQVAGLSPVYGLYGSLIPILIFAFISSSKQFVVGVDAMPAVMTGALLTTLGIESGSQEAAKLVPVISLLVAVWFIIFYFVKAGRIVKYISNPVMGGFITGVGLTIILMVTPKVLGGTAGTGEIADLVVNIVSQWKNYRLLPVILGLGTIVIIQVSKKYIPKVPMSVIMMVLGGILSAVFPLEKYGVTMLPEAAAGLPKLSVPDLRLIAEHPQDLIVESLMIALVIMAQSLLASNSYAQKYNYKINNGRELIAYSAMNVAGAAVGICPINGSVSRTGLADGFGAKSQIMSVVSAITMGLVLLFGTPLLKYLPTPVMTGVIVCALIGILDFKQAKRLWKTNRTEFFIFLMAMAGVLAFGTIYGVVIGMALSFFAVIRKAVIPPRAFLGQIPGHGDDFYNLKRNKGARPIENTVIYRFGGNLFFANIDTFIDDVEKAVTPDTEQIIVDARGIGDIDITASDRLLSLKRNLSQRGVKLYITEHSGHINDQLRNYGADELLKEGCVRRTISLALRDAGIEKPYPLVENDGTVYRRSSALPFIEAGEKLAEFEWAFGDDVEKAMENIADEIAEKLLRENLGKAGKNIDGTNALEYANKGESINTIEGENVIEIAEKNTSFGKVGLFDEDELLDYLEIQIEKMDSMSDDDRIFIRKRIDERRSQIEEKLQKLNPRAENLLHEHRLKLAQHMRENHPEEYRRILEWEEKHSHKSQ